MLIREKNRGGMIRYYKDIPFCKKRSSRLNDSETSLQNFSVRLSESARRRVEITRQHLPIVTYPKFLFVYQVANFS